jgi:AbrB family looped-hinge helix DNA binding protein
LISAREYAILLVRLEVLMNEAATTKLSSKGQVVIPEEIRDRLGLKPGAQFVVVGDRDVVILKVIQTPDMSEFDDIVAHARKAAKRAGKKQSDVEKAIRAVRGRK